MDELDQSDTGAELADSSAALAVVRLPAEIDQNCAEQVGKDLAAAFSPKARAVIADLTGTTYCDSSGVRALVLAYYQAVDNGTKLLLVAPGEAVRRVFDLTGLDTHIPIYNSIGEAMAGLPDD